MKPLMECTLPRGQVLVLMSLVLLVTLPHAFHLSPAVMGSFFGLWGVRMWLHVQRRRVPGAMIKALLTLTGVAVVWLAYHTVVGMEGGVALLVVMLGLKLMEVHARRDLFLVCFLGYFTVITQFLYNQEMAFALYLLLVSAGFTALLVEINQVHPSRRPWQPLVRAGAILAQSLPAALLLFLLFPRLDAPLWNFNLQGNTGMTGLSDRMAPGSVGNLAQSNAVAFRAEFEGLPPDPENRYWRGPVFWYTDGREWRKQYTNNLTDLDVVPLGDPIDYWVTMEPSGQKWLLALDLPAEAPDRAFLTTDYQVLARVEIETRRRYRMHSYLGHRTGRSLGVLERNWGLQLPDNITPRVWALAEDLRNQSRNDAEVVDAVLRHFNTQPFVYTLSPPVLRTNPMDEFLFETQKGFCEHYAAAFVTLMRLAGVPARVVTGYQGGEYNPLGGYLIVRQSSAHAWAEVWLEGQGWVRVDPTAAVAPERVQRAIDFGGQTEGEPVTFSEGSWTQRLYLFVDTVNAAWNVWVLGFNDQNQAALLAGLGLDQMKRRGMAILMVLLVTGFLAVLALILFQRGRVRPDPLRRAYDRFCAVLARRRELPRLPHEGPADYAARVVARFPELRQPVEEITRLYIALRYGPASSREGRRRLEERVRSFRP